MLSIDPTAHRSRRTAIITLLCLILVAAAGCARHVVAEREGGVVNSKASTSSYSDPSWTVSKEPQGDDDGS